MSALRQSDIAVMMRELVEEVRAEFPVAIASIVAGLRDEVPEFAGDDVDASRFRYMCEQQFLTVAALLSAAPDPGVVAPAAVTPVFAREAFWWGLSADTLLRLFSVGLRAMWAWWREVFDTHVEDPASRIAVIDRGTQLLFAYHQTMVRVSVQEYHQAQAASRLGMADRRLRIVRRILESSGTGEVAATSQRLGYDLGGEHVGFVVWIEDPDDDDDDQAVHLAQAVRRWFSEQDTGRPLLLPVDGHTFWAWQTTRQAPSEVLQGAPPEAPLRVAIGQPARGIDGFRTTHREALAARRTALATGSDARLAWHADLETMTMVTDDVEALRRYVAHKLGALAADDDRTAELRQAVRAYLEAGGQVAQAAATIRVHRNTLARRIETAEGHRSLEHDRAGLSLALEIAAAHGSRVLGTD